MCAHTPLIDDYHLLTYDVLDSTNEEAKRLATGGASHGAVIWSKSQTGGKGRMGREWISPEGNLYASFLLKPEQALEILPQLSFVAAVACMETIEAVVADAYEMHCKWPNDILLSGKKIAGILLESFQTEDSVKGVEQWIVVGIGMNIDSFPEQVIFPATSLRAQGVELISAKIVLSRLVYNFMQQYDHWCKKGFQNVRKIWTGRAYKLGHAIEVLHGDDILKGKFEGIDTQGAMLLKLDSGQVKTVSFGDVQVAS